MKRSVCIAGLVICGFCLNSVGQTVYPLAPPGVGVNGDWAFLSKYHDANAQLKPDSARVVFMGDSITEAWAKEPFIAANPHFVGRGISAQTTLQMVVRFRSDVIDLAPKVVHIMAGTNDIAGNHGPESDRDIEGAFESMVELALANHIRVVLASIPPAADFGWHPGLHPSARIQRINAWIQAYAKRRNVVYVDYWPAIATGDGAMKADLSSDGVHPNPKGYGEMQTLAERAINSALAKN